MEKVIEYSWNVRPDEPPSTSWKERDIFDEILRKYLPEPVHCSGSEQGTEISKVYSLEALTVFVVKHFTIHSPAQREQTISEEWAAQAQDAEKNESHPYSSGTTRVHLFYSDEQKDLAQRIFSELEQQKKQQQKASSTDPTSPVHSHGR